MALVCFPLQANVLGCRIVYNICCEFDYYNDYQAGRDYIPKYLATVGINAAFVSLPAEAYTAIDPGIHGFFAGRLIEGLQIEEEDLVAVILRWGGDYRYDF